VKKHLGRHPLPPICTHAMLSTHMYTCYAIPDSVHVLCMLATNGSCLLDMASMWTVHGITFWNQQVSLY
jgi:hypothetical protein